MSLFVSVRITFLLVLGRFLLRPQHTVGAFNPTSSVKQLRSFLPQQALPTNSYSFGQRKVRHYSQVVSRNVLRAANSKDTGDKVVDHKTDNSSESCKMKVLGVMGGIGSGKSTACQLLLSEIDDCKERIDADKIAHEVYLPGSAVLTEIVDEFGASLVLPDTGELNRKALGQIVFGDPKAMTKLEQIVWPHVRNLIKGKLETLQQNLSTDVDNAVVILEAAVLLDAGWEDLCDAIWVIQTSRQVAMDRLLQHRGMNEDDAASRIEAQQSRRGIGNIDKEYKSGCIQAIVSNNGTQEQFINTLKETFMDPSSWK